MGLGKTKFIVPLNEHSKKMAPNNIPLCPYIGVVFSYHQRSFLLQEMGENPETHNCTVYKKRETTEHSVLSGVSPPNLSSLGLVALRMLTRLYLMEPSV